MSNKPKNYTEFWMAVAFILGGWFLYYASTENKRMVTAIRHHDLDTIVANDSVYISHITIKTVMPADSIYGDAPDKPDN